ncbi:MAG: CCA tRNA nucleotidyltransferase [Micavibrio aeruginosavorus]|nr:CCA tRNA nucleotidyltransferase [Micavibrio aeruginosavorus]
MFPPAKKIAVQDWMADPAARAVMAALGDASGEPAALFVGGCVRRRLGAAGIKAVPTGIDHGTVTAVTGGKPFEITTLRRDVETDGRHAVVAFTKDWREDAQRRDFTINTLLADAAGNVFDPTGQGVADLESRRVVFVGDPSRRIAEDYLRILRFFRFHAFYGQGAPDAAALAACRAAADKITTLSRERITQEILKILSVDNPADILVLMFENNVMRDLAHAEYQPEKMRMLCGLQKRMGHESLMARLAILAAGHDRHLDALRKYLVLSNNQDHDLALMLEAALSPTTLKERLYRYGREVGGQSLLLLAVLMDGVIGAEDMAVIRDWDIPVMPLTGEDVKRMGLAQGPEIGVILKAVEAWWVEWDFQPDRAQCLERARGLLVSGQAP